MFAPMNNIGHLLKSFRFTAGHGKTCANTVSDLRNSRVTL